MALYDYRWATGHDVALSSLTNVEDDLATYQINSTIIVPRTQPVNPFSQETISLDGYQVRDGLTNHEWIMTGLSRTAVKYIEDTYMNTNKSAEITIYTRRHNRDAYQRYNAFIAPFTFDPESYGGYAFDELIITFTNLTTPS